jgi:hypothetical protein
MPGSFGAAQMGEIRFQALYIDCPILTLGLTLNSLVAGQCHEARLVVAKELLAYISLPRVQVR